jgi:mbt repeat
MKLEAVNPSQPGQICVATIVGVIGGKLLRLKLDHLASSTNDSTILYPVDSFDIFPIGWAESNEYQLKTPILRSIVSPKVASSRKAPVVQYEYAYFRSVYK